MNTLLRKAKGITKNDITAEKAKRASHSLLNFSLYTDPHYSANWHHKQLMDALDKLERGEITRLMVFMPPRHGKSEIVSRKFPAYALGRNPERQIIEASYSATLANSMNRDTQRIIDTQAYHDVFPETTLSGMGNKTTGQGNYLRNANEFEVVGRKGRYKSVGIGGGITGSGADIAIIDDPIKNREEAESQTYRDKVHDWFNSTLYTRLEKNAKLLITLTRWHEDDLAGRLLQQAHDDPEAEQWHVISYPAIYDSENPMADPTDQREEGEALWPDKYDVDQLHTIKKTLGSYEWSALYDQQPTPATGGIFQRDWFNFYIQTPKHIQEIIQSWDLAFKDSDDNDFVVGQVWGRKGANKYLLDQIRGKLSFPETLQAIRQMSNKWPRARAKLVEDKANGPAVIASLKNEISGLIPVQPEGGKIVRAQAVSPEIEAGNIYIPQNAEFTQDFMKEITAFPNGMHDDQVDAMTQALNRMAVKGSGIVSSINPW